jgi:hypothetical protein
MKRLVPILAVLLLSMLSRTTAPAVAAEPGAEGAKETSQSSPPAPAVEPDPAAEPAREASRPERGPRRDWGRGGERDAAREGEPSSTRGAPHRHRRAPSSQDLDRIVEIAREIDPERGEQWARQRREDPAGFERAIMMRGKLMFGLLELERRHPQLFEVRLCELRAQARSKRLAGEWRALTARGSLGDAAAIEADMRAAVKEQLECGQQARAHEIVLLHEHQKKLREKLQESLANSERLIEQRMQELMKDAEREDRPEPRGIPEPDDRRWDPDFEPDNG